MELHKEFETAMQKAELPINHTKVEVDDGLYDYLSPESQKMYIAFLWGYSVCKNHNIQDQD